MPSLRQVALIQLAQAALAFYLVEASRAGPFMIQYLFWSRPPVALSAFGR